MLYFLNIIVTALKIFAFEYNIIGKKLFEVD